MNQYKNFKLECEANIAKQGSDKSLLNARNAFFNESFAHKYPYNFEFLGRPIIQYPQDMVAMQELIWEVKPDLIIETGIAHGGSLIMSASMLALLDMSEAIETGTVLDPKRSKRKVLGLDIDIRQHNREAIAAHPMSSYIQMIQGSSIAPEVIEQVKVVAKNFQRVLVCLDSNHIHDHVLAELEAYAPLTSIGSYCVVFDTIIEDMPEAMFSGRPWGPGNNPKTAVLEFIKNHKEFEIDSRIYRKLLISVTPDGWLRKIS
jgi:cephalosporin hydroxylase